MNSVRRYIRANRRWLLVIVVALVLLSALLLYKLGSLVGGLSSGELQAAVTPVGWHGIYQQPLYLPLKFVRSVVFFIIPNHGQTLTRLPNAVFGGISILALTAVIRIWHGKRLAIMTGLLFATSAWTLHVSRLASYDVIYLWATSMLLLVYAALQRFGRRAFVFYVSMLIWGILLYIPGVFWLIGVAIYVQRKSLVQLWRLHPRWQQRCLFALAGILWLPLLVIDLLRAGQFRLWLGLPRQLLSPHVLLKHFGGVFVHLFIRGPQYPDLWLGRAPLFDVFTLTVCALGIYYYAHHLSSVRSHLLALFAVLGVILVALNGPVSLSVLVPLLFVAVATGLAYLQHEWLRVFPLNPLARVLAYSLICLAIAVSGIYNLRSYFVAWPHNKITQATFRMNRRP